MTPMRRQPTPSGRESDRTLLLSRSTFLLENRSLLTFRFAALAILEMVAHSPTYSPSRGERLIASQTPRSTELPVRQTPTLHKIGDALIRLSPRHSKLVQNAKRVQLPLKGLPHEPAPFAGQTVKGRGPFS